MDETLYPSYWIMLQERPSQLSFPILYSDLSGLDSAFFQSLQSTVVSYLVMGAKNSSFQSPVS